MDARFLQRVERGSVNMRLETLLRLATTLQVTPARLLRRAALPAGVVGRPHSLSGARKPRTSNR